MIYNFLQRLHSLITIGWFLMVRCERWCERRRKWHWSRNITCIISLLDLTDPTKLNQFLHISFNIFILRCLIGSPPVANTTRTSRFSVRRGKQCVILYNILSVFITVSTHLPILLIYKRGRLSSLIYEMCPMFLLDKLWSIRVNFLKYWRWRSIIKILVI